MRFYPSQLRAHRAKSFIELEDFHVIKTGGEELDTLSRVDLDRIVRIGG